MQHLRNAGLALLVLAVSGSSAVAQGKGDWEFGMDLLGFSSSKADGASGSSTTISLNGGSVLRVAKSLTDKLQIEPNVSFGSSGDDSFKVTSTDLGVAAVFMFMPMTDAKPGFYVRPWVALNNTKVESGGSSTSDSRTNFGAGVGMKRNGMGVLWRIEAFFGMTPEKDTNPSETEFGVKVGGGFIKKAAK